MSEWINAERLKEELAKAPVWTTLSVVEMIEQMEKEQDNERDNRKNDN